MNFKEKLDGYAQLVVKSGLNMDKGRELLINAPLEAAEFVRLIAEYAYKEGAKDVIVNWTDEKISRLKYDYSPVEEFEKLPDWKIALQNGIAERGGSLLAIEANDPDAFAGVDPKKPAALVKASHRDCKVFYDGMDHNKNVWCIAAVPSVKWAKKVFPELSEAEAMDRLWNAIFKAVSADQPDPIQCWREHKASFEEKMRVLNGKQFEKLHYENSLGTNLTISLPKNHIWVGGGAQTVDGRYFFPNIPTEEIFCSPDREHADGVVYSALPLIYMGTMIDKFFIKLKEGKIVDFGAEIGYETLKQLIETDEGSHHLGEVALIPKKSPISQMGILFYNTLFDENASCHIAIGKGFPECVEGGLELSREELMKVGINDSATHVDFMIGTSDLKITGIEANGNETLLFEEGNWAF